MSEYKDVAPNMDELVARYLETGRGDLKDLIVVQCAGLVERTARRFSGIESYEDLVQVGFIGLLNALSKFDPNAGVKFNTYATYLVAGEIKHYLRDRSQTIRQPAWMQELRHKVNKAGNMLQARLGRTPTDREIAEEIGISETAVREVIQTQEILKVTSLDITPNGDDDADSDLDRLEAGSFCPEQLSVEDRLILESALGQLRDLERQVLVLFHFEMQSQTQIAEQLGISCNYVSHILRQSVTKLRKILMQEEERDRILRRQASALDYEVIDPLTGLYTEAFFRTRLEEEVHRASGNDAGVGLILAEFSGLDSLRQFYGESSVEGFLIDASAFFRDSVRRLDLVCRYGESGFALILLGSQDHVPQAMNRVLETITNWSNARCAKGSPLQVRIGTAQYPDGRTAKKLIAQASESDSHGRHAA